MSHSYHQVSLQEYRSLTEDQETQLLHSKIFSQELVINTSAIELNSATEALLNDFLVYGFSIHLKGDITFIKENQLGKKRGGAEHER